MMYWIVFALYTVIETVADQTLAWFPLYYELKIAFVIWLLSPYTRGASLIYRKFLHPLLSSKEREIDDYIVQAKERGYETMVNFGRQGLNLAAAAAVTAAVKAVTEGGQGRKPRPELRPYKSATYSLVRDVLSRSSDTTQDHLPGVAHPQWAGPSHIDL
ncbi:hypothetical protein U0070_007234 [Myodes glareolus]|uniref:Receptor expression-enhancing protein n=1 Tax=Myodes glareolus TaxID=447135 RepID=A0AAW0JRD5_MYOGA